MSPERRTAGSIVPSAAGGRISGTAPVENRASVEGTAAAGTAGATVVATCVLAAASSVTGSGSVGVMVACGRKPAFVNWLKKVPSKFVGGNLVGVPGPPVVVLGAKNAGIMATPAIVARTAF